MQVIQGFTQAQQTMKRSIQEDWQLVPKGLRESFAERFGEAMSPADAVARILEEVRTNGDRAVRKYSLQLDGTDPTCLEVPQTDWEIAFQNTPTKLKEAMQVAAKRIQSFHQASLPKSWMDNTQGYGERFTPLERVGIYIPGGTAAYPSSVLMTAIPARVAGVNEIIITTPMSRGGPPDESVLAAAHIAGVDRVYQIGGAQAIAALAYGTETIPKVDMVCGPGGIFVTLAKRMVYGTVGVDGLYGPSETIIIADKDADPVLCAADLLAQAEHDPLASPIIITTSEQFLANMMESVSSQLSQLNRNQIARSALDGQGTAIIVDTLEDAIALANMYAPEHLCLSISNPWDWVDRVRNAGGIFIGSGSPEVLGDYVAGPSHVMPTGATARFSSPLGVHQFLKVTSLVGMHSDLVRELSEAGQIIAEAEGLTAHAEAFRLRSMPAADADSHPRKTVE